MGDFRFLLALWSAKITDILTRTFHLGGGTAAPGLIAEKIDPNFNSKFFKNLKFESVVITGTNGKTTTTRMLSSILNKAGLKTIHNRAGSNLSRGIGSSLIKKSGLFGQIENIDLGIWEIDEFALGNLLGIIKPKIILINNLFRDQLDRYGEIDTIRKLWQKSLEKVSPQTTIILNADDPSLAYLGSKLKSQLLYFGIEDKIDHQNNTQSTADIRHCMTCGSPLVYKTTYFSHLGQYVCSKCQFKRPNPNIIASDIKINSHGSSFQIKISRDTLLLNITIPGLFNVYNALAATVLAYILKINTDNITQGLASFKTVFGRTECIKIGDKEICLSLVKNPTGFDEVLRTIFTPVSTKNRKCVLIAINDLLADGRDVSWLWDVNFELMKDQIEQATISGIRAEDMALRLKYAKISNFSVQKDLKKALRQSLDKMNNKSTLYVLPTYTAMLEMQKILRNIKVTGKYWEE